ncbi:MAG TPA: hypothetical protein PLK94_08755 [Alphaproteobacteria bacterium]|nr:hypothetical protein [Alphaproteobacteria bacterium]HOO51360.1 hypothetical protein [Alphaproteobacteria bacterium]
MLSTILVTHHKAEQHHDEMMGATHHLAQGLSKPSWEGSIATLGIGVLGSLSLVFSGANMMQSSPILSHFNMVSGAALGAGIVAASLTTGLFKATGQWAQQGTLAHKDKILEQWKERFNALGVALYTCATIMTMGEAALLTRNYLQKQNIEVKTISRTEDQHAAAPIRR